MLLERKPKIEKTNIFNICVGDCFAFDNSIFMRVGYQNLELECPECERDLDADDLFCNTNTGYVAIDLATGELYQFGFEEVTPITVKAVEM